jgi:ADP-ribosylglycohydrolase
MGDEGRDRVVGCVLGLALGDALGAPFQDTPARAIPRPLPAFERPWMGLPPGATTDDTAMARVLMASLVAVGRFDPEELVSRLAAWFATQPPGVGVLTRRVLARVEAGTPAPVAAREVWELRGPEVSAGNGSVGYCAPLGAWCAPRPERLTDLAPALSALTHYDQRCRTACVAVTLAVAALVNGYPPALAVEQALGPVEALPGGEELEFLVEVAGSKRPVDGPDRGFCLYAAAVGLQAVVAEGGFEARLRAVVALGGDTGTNASVAGALLGAALGEAGLPRPWLDRLRDAEAIRVEAESLARAPGPADPQST